MIKVGIIGCGKIAQVRHLPEYEQNPNAEIYALYDINWDRTKELAERYGAIACESLEQLLGLDELDAVSICSANFAHAEHALACLNAKKHVLCEKPMAPTVEECVAMVEAAKANGVQLMIDQNQRLAAAHALAKGLIESGELGQVLSFATNFCHGGPETWSIDPGKNSWFFNKEKAQMGAIGDLGVHKVDLLQYLIGEPFVNVSAKVTTLDKRGPNGELIAVDDNAICILESASGVVGTMHASWTCYGAEQNHTTIFGTKGVLKLYSDPSFSAILEKPDGSRVLYEVDRIQTNDNQTASGVIDAFVDALVKGEDVSISGESVLSAMKVVVAAQRSSELGRRVSVEELNA